MRSAVMKAVLMEAQMEKIPTAAKAAKGIKNISEAGSIIKRTALKQYKGNLKERVGDREGEIKGGPAPDAQPQRGSLRGTVDRAGSSDAAQKMKAEMNIRRAHMSAPKTNPNMFRALRKATTGAAKGML